MLLLQTPPHCGIRYSFEKANRIFHSRRKGLEMDFTPRVYPCVCIHRAHRSIIFTGEWFPSACVNLSCHYFVACLPPSALDKRYQVDDAYQYWHMASHPVTFVMKSAWDARKSNSHNTKKGRVDKSIWEARNRFVSFQISKKKLFATNNVRWQINRHSFSCVHFVCRKKLYIMCMCEAFVIFHFFLVFFRFKTHAHDDWIVLWNVRSIFRFSLRKKTHPRVKITFPVWVIQVDVTIRFLPAKTKLGTRDDYIPSSACRQNTNKGREKDPVEGRPKKSLSTNGRKKKKHNHQPSGSI